MFGLSIVTLLVAIILIVIAVITWRRPLESSKPGARLPRVVLAAVAAGVTVLAGIVIASA